MFPPVWRILTRSFESYPQLFLLGTIYRRRSLPKNYENSISAPSHNICKTYDKNSPLNNFTWSICLLRSFLFVGISKLSQLQLNFKHWNLNTKTSLSSSQASSPAHWISLTFQIAGHYKLYIKSKIIIRSQLQSTLPRKLPNFWILPTHYYCRRD